jgi:hypothetical protein
MDALTATVLVLIVGAIAAASIALRRRSEKKALPLRSEAFSRSVRTDELPRTTSKVPDQPAETPEMTRAVPSVAAGEPPPSEKQERREPAPELACGSEAPELSEIATCAKINGGESETAALQVEAVSDDVTVEAMGAPDAEDVDNPAFAPETGASAELGSPDMLPSASGVGSDNAPAVADGTDNYPASESGAPFDSRAVTAISDSLDSASFTGGEAADDTASRPADTDEVSMDGPSVSAIRGAPHVEALVAKLPQRHTPAQYRDQRGRKRRQPPEQQPETKSPQSNQQAACRAPADLRLRLLLHPIHHTAQLSLILMRSEGFPTSTTILLPEPVAVGAYSDSRYDDVDLDWQPDTLSSELRYSSVDGFRWTRSARRFHLFTIDPAETGLISVSAARIGVEHSIVCTLEDALRVEAIVATTGSTTLRSHDCWHGIPAGWTVLSGFLPARAAQPISDPNFTSLDPGFDLKIGLIGGLSLRVNAFAEGHPPRIEIDPLPDGVSVSIDGEQAWQNQSGSWQSSSWGSPGTHLVDVVPGPSLTYEIVRDPAKGAGWPVFNAHEERFSTGGPWARAQICGASVFGPGDESVIAHEACQTLIALGSANNAVQLQQRPDADVSVGLLPSPPAFLLVSKGPRRHQGEIVWLGLEPANSNGPRVPRVASPLWARTIRLAISRRLPLQACGGKEAKELWQKAKRRARSLRRRSRE